MKRITTLALLSLVLSAPVMAQSTDRIDNRQQKQEQRIDQGVQSGSLNQKEVNRLDKQQDHIDKMENKALSDGTVTNKERARIEHAQDKQNRRIARQKHDRNHDFNHNGVGDRKDRHNRRHGS